MRDFASGSNSVDALCVEGKTEGCLDARAEGLRVAFTWLSDCASPQ
jgi:hypothetical protein